MDFARVIRAVRRSWKIIAATIAAGVILGYVVPKFAMGRDWEASAVLVYQGRVVVRDGEEDIVIEPRALRTLVDSIKLHKNVQKVADIVGSKTDPELFSEKIDLTFDLESNMVEISGYADSASGAAELSNTMVDVFLEHRLAVERNTLLMNVEQIESSLRGAREKLNAAREKYDDFRKEKGISDLNTERERAIANAATLRANADLAAADLKAKEARSSSGGSSAGGTTAERAELAALKSRLREALARYTDEHPTVQGLRSQISHLQAGMKGSTGPSGRVLSSREREAELRRQAEKAQKRVREYSVVEGKAANLLAQVQVGEAHVEGLASQLARAEAAARNPSTGFRVEARAVPPSMPSRGTERYAVAIAIPIVFLLFALGYALHKEFGELAVCTPSEVAYWGKGPVVGSTEWPRNNAALDELISEMEDSFAETVGRTLVVPATRRELGVVEAISKRFSEAKGEAPQEAVSADQNPVFVSAVDVLPPPNEVHENTSIAPSQSTSLARREPEAADTKAIVQAPGWASSTLPWMGPEAGPTLRRAARTADRVLVVVRAGETKATELLEVPGRLGRTTGIAYLPVAVHEDFRHLPDRIGPVREFWRTYQT